MSGLVDALCFAPVWVDAESLLLCWGADFSGKRAGAAVVALSVPGSNATHPKPVEILSLAYTDCILSVNCLLSPAQCRCSRVMQKSGFLQQLQQNLWPVLSTGAETLKVTLSLLVAGTNEGAAG